MEVSIAEPLFEQADRRADALPTGRMDKYRSALEHAPKYLRSRRNEERCCDGKDICDAPLFDALASLTPKLSGRAARNACYQSEVSSARSA